MTIALPPDRPADAATALYFVEWTPGNHAPSGPIQNLVDLRFEDSAGAPVRWRRDESNVYRHIAEPAPGAASITARFSYITNQPAVNSRSTDTYGFRDFGGLNWNTVLLYPEWADRASTTVAATLTLPDGWRAATPLRRAAGTEGPTLRFDTVTLAELIDSPVIFGLHLRSWEMPEIRTSGGPAAPHALHAVGPRPEVLDLPGARLDKIARVHAEAAAVFGAFPYTRFDYLVMLGNNLPNLGVEHASCTLVAMGEDRFTKAETADGDPMLVLPHEYAHVWSGKLAAPRGLLSGNYHTPANTSLLWVYEGLASYYDLVLGARAGLISPEEFAHEIATSITTYDIQTGRRWRSVEDTALAMRFLRAPSEAWDDLRRNQDYYGEGALFWARADAIIRRATNGERSLDDFCKALHEPAPGRAADPGVAQRTYTREDVVAALRAVHAGEDWDAMIRRHIETPKPEPGSDLAAALGRRLEWAAEPNAFQKRAEQRLPDAGLRASIGLAVAADGRITRVRAGSAADRARLAVGMDIVGVRSPPRANPRDGAAPLLRFTPGRLRDAVRATSAENPSVGLLLADGEALIERSLDFQDGLVYPRLVPLEGQTDWLLQIAQPRGGSADPKGR